MTIAPCLRLLLVAAGVLGAAGCSDDETRRLAPVSVALADTVPPIYDDGELTIYEARTSLMLPIIAPTEKKKAILTPITVMKMLVPSDCFS